MKTLIVDDDFISRLILQETLKLYGDVHIAANGEEAILAARTALEAGGYYDLICLDIVMPGMSGHEALNRIRSLEEEKDIMPGDGAVVVMTTSMDDAESFRSALKGHCDYYLLKPVDPAKLTAFLERADLIG